MLFRDTAFPDGGWRLKELLDPELRRQVNEQLDVDYLALISEGNVTQGEESGFMMPMVIGAISAEGVATIKSQIMDFRTGEIVSKFATEARGTTHIYHYVIIVAGNEPQLESGVINGLAKEIGNVITGLNISKNIRLAILAVEDHDISLSTKDIESSSISETTIEILTERALNGDDDARWNLYRAQPNTQSLTWLCQDADKGNMRARREIGELFFYGSDKYRKPENIHIQSDLPRACMWFQLAGQAEITAITENNTSVNTKTYYESAEVERTSNVMTAHQLEEAKKLVQDWQPGQCSSDLSRLMITSYADDPALEKLCIAADMGDYSSRNELGRIYYFGSRGVPEDLARAYMWYRLAEDVYAPPGGPAMQKLCDAMTPEQRAIAVRLIEEWKPGLCEQQLLKHR